MAFILFGLKKIFKAISVYELIDIHSALIIGKLSLSRAVPFLSLDVVNTIFTVYYSPLIKFVV